MSAASTVQPDSILKELSKLWLSLAKEKEGDPAEQTATGSGVLRAISMTLIAAVDESEDPADVGETVARLMKEHPSRAITLRLVAGEGRVLTSRVYAQCWMPFGGRRQICCEQIEITASECALEDLPGVVLPLTVPDLPVILWCRSAHLFHTPQFEGISAMATKMVIDGDTLESNGVPFRQLQNSMRPGLRLADLAWTRLTRWREVIARVFEEQDLYRKLDGTVDVTIEYQNAQPHHGAYYLAAWLTRALKQCGAQPRLTMKQGEGEHLLSGFHAVTLNASGGAAVALKASAGGIDVDVNGTSTRAVYPEITDYSLLQEELSIPGRDDIFEAALQGAIELSRS